MPHPQIDQCVRLKHSIPELQLPDGAIGVVCSTWFSPQTAYEVEFRSPGLTEAMRVLVLENQLETVQEPMPLVA